MAPLRARIIGFSDTAVKNELISDAQFGKLFTF